jgi:hypothetical protein
MIFVGTIPPEGASWDQEAGLVPALVNSRLRPLLRARSRSNFLEPIKRSIALVGQIGGDESAFEVRGEHFAVRLPPRFSECHVTAFEGFDVSRDFNKNDSFAQSQFGEQSARHAFQRSRAIDFWGWVILAGLQELPFDHEPVGGQSGVNPASQRIPIRVVRHGSSPEFPEVQAGIAGDQWVESPGHQREAKLQCPFALSELERGCQARAAMLWRDGEHVRMLPGFRTFDGGETVRESDWNVRIGRVRTYDDAARVNAGDHQASRGHFAVVVAPGLLLNVLEQFQVFGAGEIPQFILVRFRLTHAGLCK